MNHSMVFSLDVFFNIKHFYSKDRFHLFFLRFTTSHYSILDGQTHLILREKYVESFAFKPHRRNV